MQSGITYTEVTADRTTDWKHRDTVTLRATIRLGENNYETSVLQFSEEAAQSLLSDLLQITAPPAPRFDLTVETTESFDEHENVEYTLRARRLDVQGDHGSAVYNFDRVLRVTAVPHEES